MQSPFKEEQLLPESDTLTSYPVDLPFAPGQEPTAQWLSLTLLGSSGQLICRTDPPQFWEKGQVCVLLSEPYSL